MRRPEKLLLATHNIEKIIQIKEILQGLPIPLITIGDLNLPEPAETGSTFGENSLIKAKAATMATGVPAIADDSGICIEALDDEPGIHSARWADPDRNYKAAMATIEDGILKSKDPTNRKAKMVCCVTLYWPDGKYQVFENEILGTWVWPGRGERTFGYDPCFQPEGHNRTFGEMTIAEKISMCHRSKSFAQLKQYLLSLS